MADGKITIDAEVSAKRAEAQLLSLEAKMTKLADKIKSLKAQRNILPTEEFAKASKRYDEAAAGMDRWTEKMYKLSKAGKENSAEFKKAENAADGYEGACERAEEQMTALKEAGKQFQAPGDAGYDELTAQIAQAEAEMDYLGARWKQTNAGMTASSAETGASIKTQLAGAATAIYEAYTRMSQTMVKGFQTMYKWASKAAGIIKGALVKALGSAVAGFRNIFTGGRSASSAIADFNKRLLNLVKAAFVFNVIRKALSAVTSGIGDAVKGFATYNSELNGNISAMQTALAGLQGSIASAFAPIINAAVPAIVTLINYLTAAVNALGMFFSALTGKTSYTKLIANQKNYAGALNDTSKAAKSASSNLAKFDDLDVLNKDTGSGSGSSGSGTDFSGTEEVPIDGALKDLADMLKNGQYFDFGYTLADMIADQLEQIPWDEIREKALAAGQNLAEILNGVFANLRFAVDLGVTLAQALNTALDFLYGFITSFNWTQFGVWWGYFFNAFVQTMDWDLLGDTILAGINGVIAAVKAFFTTIYTTMQELGQKLGSNVQKVFQGIDWTGISDTILMGLTDLTALINGWNLEVNWTENADALLNGVNELAQGMVMDPNGTIHQVWSENGTAVGTAIQNFLSGCHEFVSAFPYEQLTESISQWFRSAMEAINWSEVGDTINQLVTGLIDSITQFISDNKNKQAIVKAITDLFRGLDLAEITGSIFELMGSLLDLFTQSIEEMDWTTIGVLILAAIVIGLLATDPIILAVAAITLLLAELLLKLVEDIVEWCYEWMSQIATTITEAGAAITQAWNDFWTAVFNKAKEIWDSIKTTVKTVLNEIKTFIQTTINNIKSTWTTIWTAISTITTTIWNAITTTVKTILNAVKQFIQTTANTIKTIWTTIWTAISTITSTIWNAITTTIQTVLNAIKNFIQTTINAIKTVWNTIWTAIKTIITTVLNEIHTLVNTQFTNIKNFITTVLDAIKTVWTTAWNAIKTVVSTIWNAIKSVISTALGDTGDKINQCLDSIGKAWSDAWNGMKDTLKGIINGIIGLVNGMLDAIANGINSVVDALNSISVDIPSWVPGVGGSHFGLSLSHVSAPHIPTLANGGITTGATLAEIGEAGREAVLPLEQNTGWMDDLAMKIADVIDSRTGTGINSVTMELNGQELARVALDDLVSEINRRGMTVDTVFA